MLKWLIDKQQCKSLKSIACFAPLLMLFSALCPLDYNLVLKTVCVRLRVPWKLSWVLHHQQNPEEIKQIIVKCAGQYWVTSNVRANRNCRNYRIRNTLACCMNKNCTDMHKWLHKVRLETLYIMLYELTGLKHVFLIGFPSKKKIVIKNLPIIQANELDNLMNCLSSHIWVLVYALIGFKLISVVKLD